MNQNQDFPPIGGLLGPLFLRVACPFNDRLPPNASALNAPSAVCYGKIGNHFEKLLQNKEKKAHFNLRNIQLIDEEPEWLVLRFNHEVVCTYSNAVLVYESFFDWCLYFKFTSSWCLPLESLVLLCTIKLCAHVNSSTLWLCMNIMCWGYIEWTTHYTYIIGQHVVHRLLPN